MTQHLLLTDGFNPYNVPENRQIKHEKFVFPGGEPHIRLEGFNSYSDVHIVIRINSFNDLGMLLVAHEALRNSGYLGNCEVTIPYFPGARQDRVANDGEPLTVRVYADIIDALELDNVWVLDPHSDVTPAVLNNCDVINNHKFVEEVLRINDLLLEPRSINLVAPDAGANKKIIGLAQYLQEKYPDHDLHVVKCDKERDTLTGKIVDFEVPEFPVGYLRDPFFIVDDICDGGGTFIGLAKELQDAGVTDLHLVVTHGIFSKGFKELNKHFKAIYTTDSIFSIEDPSWSLQHDKTYDILTQIKLCNML